MAQKKNKKARGDISVDFFNFSRAFDWIIDHIPTAITLGLIILYYIQLSQTV